MAEPLRRAVHQRVAQRPGTRDARTASMACDGRAAAVPASLAAAEQLATVPLAIAMSSGDVLNDDPGQRW
ncbi:hypothetical protein [Streptomyces sp. NBC_01361]|uniref:hypothetical protein n=1 Tax=Streptomyces sp. NBC_01361 TaxID=2903838 RepID=UPI002E2F3AD0|nr:hypothetical protein [Streptomyces sp. NBC_01361]